jgi:hypothetical protein
MHVEIYRKLVDRGIIHENTEITATYFGKDLAGTKTSLCKGNFYVKAVRILSDTAYFDAVNTIDGSLHTIKSTQVECIDGMELKTLASVFSINPNGGKIVEGKRRGRKPKQKEI